MWWLFLASAVGPLAKRVLYALGFSTITYVGLQAAFTAAENAVVGAFGGITGDLLQIVSLAGVGQAIGIILGALAGRISLVALTFLGKSL